MKRACIQGTRSIILFIFLPFMSCYMLSELYRNVNGVAGQYLRADLGIGPEQLGFLTSVYLAAISGSQLFVGVLLDRYGPRRVVGSLMVIAAIGSVLFASDDFAQVVAGRFLMGFGMAACWTASYKANVMWFPPERLALANGASLGLSGLGALAGTLPTELVLEHWHWHTVFMVLGGVALVMALGVWTFVPDHDSDRSTTRPSFLSEFAGLGTILRDPTFRKVGPISFLSTGVWLAYQGLWAGVWMREVDGLASRPTASNLMTLALAVVLGQLVFGLIADRLSRWGISLWTMMFVTCALFVGVQGIILLHPEGLAQPLWIFFGLFTAGPIFAYALISLAVPWRLAGRALALLNFFATMSGFALQYAVGAIIEFWSPDADGLYPIIAHETALGMLLLIQVVALVWMAIPSAQLAGSLDTRPD